MTESQLNIKRWRENPIDFVREVFGVEPDPWQAEILNNFNSNNRISMQACKGPGKTCILAWLCWLFLVTRPNPKMAATSISEQNLSDNLWPEMSKWQQKSPMLQELFQWTKTRIFLKSQPETWFMSARNWSKQADPSQQADTLAGLHADYLMFILDEAGGIPDSVMAAAEAGLASGIETKILMAGNPTNLSGPLYRASVTDRHMWYVVEITGDPNDPKRSPRVSAQWAKDQIAKWGIDNPWVLTNVFGKFPPSSFNTLLSITEVQEAMSRFRRKDDYQYAQKRLGVDVARFGSDSTVLFPRQGLVAFKPFQMRNATTPEIASRIMSAMMSWDTEMHFVDGTGGFGAGVIDSLKLSGIEAHEVHFSGKADDDRYANKRAEMWFRMAEWVKNGGALPPMMDMVREFTEPQYTFTAKGKLIIESKEQIKTRLQYSPDHADALALTFTLVDMPGKNHPRVLRQMSENHGSAHRVDFDPYRDEVFA